ncbi:hypothetical protein M0805_008045 [Coniferiporia weirii]|nr:hypothetical protein M0805_008045 [Coniferiporia weirii]
MGNKNKSHPAPTKRAGGVKASKGSTGLLMKAAEGHSRERLINVAARYEALDPRYAYDLRTGKRVERPVPEGLSDEDKKILTKVRKRARRLDYGMNLCGLRFGRSAVIGFIPAAGPIVDVVLGVSLVILEARKADLPWSLTLMMYLRHCVSEGIGMTPGVGEIFIGWYKANSRNSWALERFLEERGRKNLLERVAEGSDAVGSLE